MLQSKIVTEHSWEGRHTFCNGYFSLNLNHSHTCLLWLIIGHFIQVKLVWYDCHFQNVFPKFLEKKTQFRSMSTYCRSATFLPHSGISVIVKEVFNQILQILPYFVACMTSGTKIQNICHDSKLNTFPNLRRLETYHNRKTMHASFRLSQLFQEVLTECFLKTLLCVKWKRQTAS